MQRRYYLHQRRGIFYAELVDPATGLKLTARSCGTANRDDALLIVADWLKNGIPKPRTNKGDRRSVTLAFDLQAILTAIRKADIDATGAMQIVSALKERELIDIPAVAKSKTAKNLVPELLRFWDYEKSEYIRDKLAHGHTIGKRHAYEMTNRVKKNWSAYFADKPLLQVTRKDLKNFAFELLEGGLSTATVNLTMSAGLTAFAYWHREGIMPTNLADGFERFTGDKEKRGVLTVDEAAALFSRKWADDAARVGNLLSATTGLRAGEVLAIRKSDIGDTVLNVVHSWTGKELKAPKNGEARKVPLLPEVRAALLELLKGNPHTASIDPFVFWGIDAEKPRSDGKFLLDGLHRELDAMGIQWRERNIVFHSHRHFYAARMSDIATADKVRRITGHRSAAVFESYADHVTEQNLIEMLELERDAFAGLVA
jgi:integrase